MKVVAFLPAKGTSERIESKNMKLLNGKPLFLHTLEKLVSCDFIDEVYLDSESDEILNYAPFLNYKPLKRDPALADNRTDGHQMFYNEVRQVEADIYIQVLGTSPFISKETIRAGIDVLVNHPEYDSAILMKKEKLYLWEENPDGQVSPLYDKFHIPNSKALPDTLIESMGLYIVRSDMAYKTRMRFGENVFMLTGSAIETVDVNYPDEFELAEVIMRGLQEKENRLFRLAANYFSSAVFSDILSEMGIENTIGGFTCNFPQRKVMGRANTLKLRKLKDGEDYRGIYDALETYARITPGEIIVVENEIEDRAYFGDLNANLAIRAGVVATIVGGVTRDISAVSRLDYPVFSKGYCSADVKYKATIESHQMPVRIEGVAIYPGDLLFADNCGIVCIPRNVEAKVMEKAIKAVGTEKNILARILKQENAMEIYNKEGEF